MSDKLTCRIAAALGSALLLSGAGCAAKSTLGASEAAKDYRGRIRSVFVEDRITSPMSPSYTQGIIDALARCGVAATVHRPAEGQASDPKLAARHDATLSMQQSSRESVSFVNMAFGMLAGGAAKNQREANVVTGVGHASSVWPSRLTDDATVNEGYVLYFTEARTQRVVWRGNVGIFRGSIMNPDRKSVGGEVAQRVVADMASHSVLPCGTQRQAGN